MITTTQMYWLTRLDRFNSDMPAWLVLVIIIMVFATLFVAMVKYEDSKDVYPLFRKVFFAGIVPVTLVIFGLKTFVPSTKEMAAILVIPKIVNNERVQQAGDRLYQLATEWMEELRPKRFSEQKEGEQK